MRSLVITALGAALFSCAPASPPQPEVHANARSCISLANIGGRRVVAPDTLLFEMAGPVNFRNRLATHCPPTVRLGPSATVVFLNPQGGQICTGDRVRIVDFAENIATSPECLVGPFEPVTAVQKTSR